MRALHSLALSQCFRSWKIYSDFLLVCKCGDIDAIQAFHDAYVRLQSPHIYGQIMATAAHDLAATDASTTVLYWFSKTAVENKQLK